MPFFRRARSVCEIEMTDEMRFHVEMETEDLIRMGVAPDDARRRALATFGGVRRFTEEAEEARSGSWLDDLRRDVKYGLRSLARTPGYAIVVILTLALGIAANTSIFSVANGILFKRLPYPDPSRLLVLWDDLGWMGVPEAWVTGREIGRLRRDLRQFEGFAAIRPGSSMLAGDRTADPLQVPTLGVSANFFDVLGAHPGLGRGFAKGEDAVGARRVIVVSNRLFTQRFGADTSIVGRAVMLDGQPATIVGVLSPRFTFAPQLSLNGGGANADIYTTITDTLERLPVNNHSLGVVARIRGDVAPRSALAELAALSKRIDQDTYDKRGFRFAPVMLQERMVREVRPALYALLGAVAMLLLIMCANLAVLALARSARREHEFTVRRAIGASQSRMARQILTETILLAIGGAIAGTVLGVWALRGLLGIAPPGLPRRDEIGIDLAVLAITLLVAVVIGVAMGLAPVFQSAKNDIATVLRERAPSRIGGGVRRALLLGQLALSMMLLAATGLLLGSFVKLTAVDPGFDSHNVLSISLMATRGKYTTGQPVIDIFNRYVAAVRAVPGVMAVGASAATPLSGGPDQSGIGFPSSPTNTGDRERDWQLGDVAPVSPGYLHAIGIQLFAGREFTSEEHDSASSNVAIIDDQFAGHYFPGPKSNVIGQTVTIDGAPLRVVGVSRHVRMYNLEDAGRSQIWVPHANQPFRSMTLVVRTSGDPLKMSSAVKKAIHSVDAQQAIATISTMDAVVRDTLAQRRLVLILVTVFAVSALLLVALGIYGITASAVAQRTRELGIRMALGASPRNVVVGVLAEPTRLVAIGLVIGLIGTWLAGRAVQRLLYDVRPNDPLVLAGVSAVLIGVAALASYIPARRATGVDPVVALRSD